MVKEEEVKAKERIPVKEEKKEIIPKEQIKEVIEGAKLAGMSPEEIGRMLKELLR